MAWIEDASRDPRLAQHPGVTGEPGLRFLAAAPLPAPNGRAFGALCLFDTKPRPRSEAVARWLRDFAAAAAALALARFAALPRREVPESLADSWADPLAGFSQEVLAVIAEDTVLRYLSGPIEALLGRAQVDLIGLAGIKLVHPDEREMALQEIAAMSANPAAPRRAELRLRHGDGSWRQLEVVGQNFPNHPQLRGIYLRMRDVSERHQFLRRIEHSESRYRQLFDNNPLPVWVYDWDHPRMLAVNDAALEKYGYNREEFLALPLEAIRPPEDIPILHAYLARREQGPVRAVWRRRRKDGAVFVVEAVSRSLDFDGRRARMVVEQDVTERLHALQSLEQRNRYMAAQVEILVELLKPRPLPDCIRAGLAVLGRVTESARAGWFVNVRDPRTGRLQAAPAGEWCAPGIFAKSEVFPHERIAWDACSPEWGERLRRGELLALLVDELPEPEHSLFAAGGVRSALLAPVLVRGEFAGFLGLDDCAAPREWSRAETDLLQSAAAGVALALEAESVSESLEEEKDRFAVTLASIADGVVTTDASGRISFANRVAEHLLGLPQAELQGQDLARFFQSAAVPAGTPRADSVGRVLTSGEVVIRPGGAWALRRDDTRVSVAMSTAPIRNRAGKIIGAVRVFRDVTNDQRMAAELAKASKLESLGLLAGGIAHDFNNILTAVLGNISLAKMFLASQAERAQTRLDEAERASYRARDLTAQLLTFARGGAPIKQLARLPDLIRESTEFALHGSSVQVRFTLPDDLPAIEVDPVQLSQVINNLVINAVQAQPDGGLLDVWAQARDLEEGHPTGLPAGRYVKICVEDAGKGIPAENFAKIFDPFFTTKERGSGLGLATTYSIVKNHGGSINFDSIVGHGTIFRVYLPVSAEPAASAAMGLGAEPARDDRVALPDAPPPTPGSAGRVLVMDDEEDIRSLASGMLEQLGYECVAAADGVAAVEEFERARVENRPFDALILDLTVPGGFGGLEVLNHLRLLDPEVSAVVSSGYANAPIMADYARHGFRDILAKPYRLADLATVLERVVRRAAPRSPAA